MGRLDISGYTLSRLLLIRVEEECFLITTKVYNIVITLLYAFDPNIPLLISRFCHLQDLPLSALLFVLALPFCG